MKVQSRWPDGALKYSYRGRSAAAAGLLRRTLGRAAAVRDGLHPRAEPRTPGFALRGEGKTTVNKSLSGYEVLYTADVEGRAMYGRDVLLLPERARVRAKAWTS